MTLVYLNGRFVEAENATVSIQDRGFRFGDGLFETIRVKNGAPYLLEKHLERLKAGLDALRIPGSDLEAIRENAKNLIHKNAFREGSLRIQVTRGEGSRGYLPLPDATPTLIMETIIVPATPYEPVKLWLSSYEKISPKALPVAHKLSQGLNSTLALLEAQEKGCEEALLLNSAGELTEAAGANLFFLREGILHTPSLACGALAGIIRQRLIEISPLPVLEGRYRLEDLRRADAVFLTNTRFLVQPVSELLPEHYAWFSESAAKPMLEWLEADVAQYCN